MKQHCQNLIEEQQEDLLNLKKKTEELFDKTLSTWKTYPIYF